MAAVARVGIVRLPVPTQLTVLTVNVSGDRACHVSLDEDAQDLRTKDTLAFIDGWKVFLERK
jgi:hypothetical protein